MILSFSYSTYAQKLKVSIEYDIISSNTVCKPTHALPYLGLSLPISLASFRPGQTFGQAMMHNLSPGNAGRIVPSCTGIHISLLDSDLSSYSGTPVRIWDLWDRQADGSNVAFVFMNSIDVRVLALHVRNAHILPARQLRSPSVSCARPGYYCPLAHRLVHFDMLSGDCMALQHNIQTKLMNSQPFITRPLPQDHPYSFIHQIR